MQTVLHDVDKPTVSSSSNSLFILSASSTQWVKHSEFATLASGFETAYLRSKQEALHT